MRFFFIATVVCVVLTMGICIYRDSVYPKLAEGWNRSWLHHAAMGLCIAATVNFVIFMYLWGKAWIF